MSERLAPPAGRAKRRQTPKSASQNSFLIPTSQKVAEPRVSSGAEIKNYVPAKCTKTGLEFTL
jgi:hypothetical protein